MRGILYSATGATFVEEAIASAKSSLRFNPSPHLIFCDRLPDAKIDGIEFARFEPSGNPYADKIRNLSRTPFERTIYLDTDTYVTDRIGELFDLLERFDIAATHAPGYTKCNDTGQSEAFYDFNTGVIPYRKTPEVEKLLSNWKQIFTEWHKSPPFPMPGMDQPAFRRAVWESSVYVYVLGPEYNCRTIFPGCLTGVAKILHGRCGDYERATATLNQKRGRRLFRPLS